MTHVTPMPADLFNIRRARLIKWQHACVIAGAFWLGCRALHPTLRVAYATSAMRMSVLAAEYL